MQISAQNMLVCADAAFRCTVGEPERWSGTVLIIQVGTATNPGMDLVTTHLALAIEQYPVAVRELFVWQQLGVPSQLAKSRLATGLIFDTFRIVNRLAQHLQTTANTDDLAAQAQMTLQRLIPALCA